MSVLDTAVYRDDAFQAAVRVIGISKESLPLLTKLLDFETDGSEGVKQNISLKKGNVKDQVEKDPSAIVNLTFGFPKARYRLFATELSKYKDVKFGLKAVYEISYILIKRAKGLKIDWSLENDLFRAGCIIGQRTPKEIYDTSYDWTSYMNSKCFGLLTMFNSLLKVANSFTRKMYKADLNDYRQGKFPKVDIPEADHLGFDNPLVLPGVLFLPDFDTLYVITRNDIDRMEKLIKGIALARLYVHGHSFLKPEQRAKFELAEESYEKIMLNAMKKVNYNQAQILCRAYDIAYNTFLAQFACDIDTKSLVEQTLKFKRDKCDEFLNLEEVIACTNGLPMREGMEIMQIYKILPQPDFDLFGAMKRQQELYSKQNKLHEGDIGNLIIQYHKILMIRAFYSRHHYCPGFIDTEEDYPDEKWLDKYPNVNPIVIKPNMVHVINLQGAFSFVDHPLDAFDLVKDKAICPYSVENLANEGHLQQVNRKDKNYLLDILSRDPPVNVSGLQQRVDKLFFDVKCEDKAEAKKPHGRWFMEAHSDIRLLLSEYELSIAQYGKYLEGFMQGKGLIEKQKMMNHVMEYIEEFEGYKPTYVSFDIEKFSPRLPFSVHKILDEQWSEAFGKPHIKELSRIFSDGNMHYLKHAVHATMPKQGNDYEGFAGRKLTFYHLAVMYAARHILDERKILAGGYRFAAQIDDGLMRLNVNVNKYAELRQTLEGLWMAAGMKISWDKTFVSANFAVFLNDVRMQGRSIGSGMRAFVKIRNYVRGITQSLPNDLQTAESTVRGALVAGATPKIAYYAYSLFVADAIRKWAPRTYKHETRCVPWYFAPVALGGLGLANSQTLLGSVDYDSMITGIANLSYMSRRFPGLIPVIERILKQNMEEISDRTSVSNPASIRRVGRILRTDRMKSHLRNALASFERFPVIKQFLWEEAIAQGDAITDVISHAQDFPAETRQLWYESSVLSAIDSIIGKVLNPATAKSLLPIRIMVKINHANLTEARTLLMSY